MIEHMVIVFNPNGPKHDATQEVPNFDLLAEFLRDPFPKQGLLPIKTIIIASSNPIKSVHNKSGPSPCSPCLDAVPKCMLN